MSIWSTFKEMKVHDSDTHSEATPGQCGCLDDVEVYLSSSWHGFPLRLSIRSGDTHADAALTRAQVRELAQDLLDWADRDQRGDDGPESQPA